MKILHCADWHLRDADIEEAEKCLIKCASTAAEAKRLSFLLACIVVPLAVIVFGSLLFK